MSLEQGCRQPACRSDSLARRPEENPNTGHSARPCYEMGDNVITSLRNEVIFKGTTHPRAPTKHISVQCRRTHKNTKKQYARGGRGCCQMLFNSSASSTNVASFLHKTPPVGYEPIDAPTQCCAHDKSHACRSLLFVIHQHTAPLHLSTLRENHPMGKRGTQGSATAPRSSVSLLMVRRLTRLLYMNMDNVSTRVCRGAAKAYRVRGNLQVSPWSAISLNPLNEKSGRPPSTPEGPTRARTSFQPLPMGRGGSFILGRLDAQQ